MGAAVSWCESPVVGLLGLLRAVARAGRVCWRPCLIVLFLFQSSGVQAMPARRWGARSGAQSAAQKPQVSAEAEVRGGTGGHRDTARARPMAVRQQELREAARVLCGVSGEEERGGAGPSLGSRYAHGLMLGARTKGTKSTYASPWRHWVQYRSTLGLSAFLDGETRAEKLDDEEHLLRFLGIEVGRMGRGYSTLKVAFSSIRYHHVISGWGDPTIGKPRLAMAKSAIRRIDGHSARKVPTTTKMLRWLRDNLDLKSARGATLFAAVIVSFFFMLRASEYVAVDGHGYDEFKCFKVMDVFPRRGGVECSNWKDADEVVIHIKGSKGDTYNEGCWRCLRRSGSGSKLCPVWAMQNLYQVRPDIALDPNEFLFRHKGGEVIFRRSIQALLGDAAVNTGIPRHLIGSHSQRHGGATALYNASGGKYSEERIARFGRWASSCVKIYLWEGNENTQGVVDDMGRRDFTLHTLAFEQRKRWAMDSRQNARLNSARPPLH